MFTHQSPNAGIAQKEAEAARSMMWVLFLILSLPSIPGETRIDQFATFKACNKELIRLDKEMQRSYPGDTDFEFVCRFERKLV